MATKHTKNKRLLKKARVDEFCHEVYRQTGGLAGYPKPDNTKDNKKTSAPARQGWQYLI